MLGIMTVPYEYPIYTRHEIEATPDVLRALGMEGKDEQG
jgi:hypothetical protein